jgi:lipocalin-like protein
VTEPGVDGRRLIGGWRLRRWVAIDAAGNEVFPMGSTATGYLAYTADGTMVAMMGSGDRPPFASDDVTGGSDIERAGAFASFIAYAGRYEVTADTVIHHVEASLFPNWIGTRQHREWQLDPDGRELTLTARGIRQGGETRTHRLSWERVSEGGPGS